METAKCPDCGSNMLTEEKQYVEGNTQYETWCPECELSYTWWDSEFEEEE